MASEDSSPRRRMKKFWYRKPEIPEVWEKVVASYFDQCPPEFGTDDIPVQAGHKYPAQMSDHYPIYTSDNDQYPAIAGDKYPVHAGGHVSAGDSDNYSGHVVDRGQHHECWGENNQHSGNQSEKSQHTVCAGESDRQPGLTGDSLIVTNYDQCPVNPGDPALAGDIDQYPIPLGQDDQYLVHASGQYPEHISQYPEHIGQYPEHTGQYPGYIGQYAEHIGQYPGHMGQHPEHIGQYPEHQSDQYTYDPYIAHLNDQYPVLASDQHPSGLVDNDHHPFHAGELVHQFGSDQYIASSKYLYSGDTIARDQYTLVTVDNDQYALKRIDSHSCHSVQPVHHNFDQSIEQSQATSFIPNQDQGLCEADRDQDLKSNCSGQRFNVTNNGQEFCDLNSYQNSQTENKLQDFQMAKSKDRAIQGCINEGDLKHIPEIDRCVSTKNYVLGHPCSDTIGILESPNQASIPDQYFDNSLSLNVRNQIHEKSDIFWDSEARSREEQTFAYASAGKPTEDIKGEFHQPYPYDQEMGSVRNVFGLSQSDLSELGVKGELDVSVLRHSKSDNNVSVLQDFEMKDKSNAPMYQSYECCQDSNQTGAEHKNKTKMKRVRVRRHDSLVYSRSEPDISKLGKKSSVHNTFPHSILKNSKHSNASQPATNTNENMTCETDSVGVPVCCPIEMHTYTPSYAKNIKLGSIFGENGNKVLPGCNFSGEGTQLVNGSMPEKIPSQRTCNLIGSDGFLSQVSRVDSVERAKVYDLRTSIRSQEAGNEAPLKLSTEHVKQKYGNRPCFNGTFIGTAAFSQSDCSERSSRLDPHTYQSYAAGILNSCRPSEDFLQLQKYYSILERIAEIEEHTLHSNNLLGKGYLNSVSLLKRFNSDGGTFDSDDILLSKYKREILTELEDMYMELQDAQSKKQFFFYDKKLPKIQWSPRREKCLKEKQKSLSDLRYIYQYSAGKDNLNTPPRIGSVFRKTVPEFKRDSSFVDLYVKYKTLVDETRREECGESRKTCAAHSESSPRLVGPYMEILERTRKSRPGPILYGTNINDQFNQYEIYVSNLKKVSRSCPDLKAKLKDSCLSAVERKMGSAKQFNARNFRGSNVQTEVQQTSGVQVKSGANLEENVMSKHPIADIQSETVTHRHQLQSFHPDNKYCWFPTIPPRNESMFKRKHHLVDENMLEFDHDIPFHSEVDGKSKDSGSENKFRYKVQGNDQYLERPKSSHLQNKSSYTDDRNVHSFMRNENVGQVSKNHCETGRDNYDRSEYTHRDRRYTDVCCAPGGCSHFTCPAVGENHLKLSPGRFCTSTNTEFAAGVKGDHSFEKYTDRNRAGHLCMDEQSISNDMIKVSLLPKKPSQENILKTSENERFPMHSLHKYDLKDGEVNIVRAHVSRYPPVPERRYTDIYTQRGGSCTYFDVKKHFDGYGKQGEISNFSNSKFKIPQSLRSKYDGLISSMRDIGQNSQDNSMGYKCEGEQESVNSLPSRVHISNSSRLDVRHPGSRESPTHIKQVDCSGKKNAVFEKAVQEEIVNRGLIRNRQPSPGLSSEVLKTDRKPSGNADNIEVKDQVGSVSRPMKNALPSSEAIDLAVGSSLPNLLEYRKALWNQSLPHCSSSVSENLSKSSENCARKVERGLTSVTSPRSFSFSQSMLADACYTGQQGRMGKKPTSFQAPMRSQQYSCESLENISVKNNDVLEKNSTPLIALDQRKDKSDSKFSLNDANGDDYDKRTSESEMQKLTGFLDNHQKGLIKDDYVQKPMPDYQGEGHDPQTVGPLESVDLDNIHTLSYVDSSDRPFYHGSYPDSHVSKAGNTLTATSLDSVNSMVNIVTDDTVTRPPVPPAIAKTVTGNVGEGQPNSKNVNISQSLDQLYNSKDSEMARKPAKLKRATSSELSSVKTKQKSCNFTAKTVNKLFEYKWSTKGGEKMNPIVASVREHRTQCCLVPSASLTHPISQKPPPYQDLIGRKNERERMNNCQNKNPENESSEVTKNELDAVMTKHKQRNPNTFTLLNNYIHDRKQAVPQQKGEKG